MRELPSISASTYASNTVDLDVAGNFGRTVPLFIGNAQQFDARDNLNRIIEETRQRMAEATSLENQMATRIVQVFIADPDENIPLDKRLLYTGEQKLTDLTDQELFFEVDIKNILQEHNTYRGSVINKKVKERTEYLEPIKIRDLRMVVVTVAEFK